jgi:hypothetical protein
MKKIIFLLLLSMVIVFSAEAHKYKNRNAHITISVQTFYDELSPYGDWIYSHDYGYVWRPYFDNPESFRPYSSGGNWIYTSYGWTWNSNYDWGWATFHYGRWDFDNYLGWLWIPGTEWAPAWVTWGEYNNYWGWAPLGPNIYVQANLNWYAPDPWWTFVPRNHFCSNNWSHYIYNRPVRVTYITHITNIYVDNNYSYGNHNSWYHGPRVNDVERYNRSRVRTIEVVDNDRAKNTGVHNNRLNVYRPVVDNNRRTESRPTQYRNIEQARSGKSIEQTNPRVNDPGNIRTRSVKEDARNITKVPVLPDNNNSGRDNRVSPRTSGQVPNSRNAEVKIEQKGSSPTNSQQEQRNGSVNKESRVEPRMGTQVYPERNSAGRSAEAQRDTPNRGSNPNVNERNSSVNSPAKVEKSENRQPRNSAPDLNKVYSNASREVSNKQARETQPTRDQGNRQAPATQPTREQRTQSAAPASNSRNEKKDRKQGLKEEVKKDESKKAAENPERESGNPNRR